MTTTAPQTPTATTTTTIATAPATATITTTAGEMTTIATRETLPSWLFYLQTSFVVRLFMDFSSDFLCHKLHGREE